MPEPQPAAPLPRSRRRAVGEGNARPAAPANLNSVGQVLRTAREARDQSISEIADILKIRRTYLQAIEDSDWANLPELVYAQGFVRSYADYLGMNGGEKAAQFKKEFRGGPRKIELEMPQPIENNQTPDFKTIASVIVGLLVIYAIWAATHSRQKPKEVPPPPAPIALIQPPADAPVPTAPPSLAEQMAAAAPPAAVAAPPAPSTSLAQTTQAAPAPVTGPQPLQTGIAYGSETPAQVTITAVQDSWVQVRAADGQVVFSRVMRPGDYYRVPPDAGLTLTTGNLSGLDFTINNQNMTPPGAPGTVMRNVPLAPASLSQALSALVKNPESNDQPQ